MANRGIEPITLPWKRPEKGVSAAELGASFRVEQREEGWHCTVRVGRRTEVLATGLRRLRDAQCRAEAHAAKLPEVAAALDKQAAEAKAPAKVRGTLRPASAPAGRGPKFIPQPFAGTHAPPGASPEALRELDTMQRGDDESTAAATSETVPLPFEQVSDGCICGKIEGGTWVADPAGHVSVPSGTDPAVAQQICRVAAGHYAARRSKPAPPAKPAAKRSQPAPPAKSAKPTPKPSNKKATKRGARAVAAQAKPPAAAAKSGRKPTAATSASPPPTLTAKGKREKRGKKAVAKASSRKEPSKSTPPASARSKASADKVPAKTTAPAEEKMAKKSSKETKGEGCGCVTWTEVDGKARGTTKHGAFILEPEGKRHALYFYDADALAGVGGQSRHLQSGDAGKLRKIAEEMAARGQPAPREAASAADDAALMRAFMGGAMEDDR